MKRKKDVFIILGVVFVLLVGIFAVHRLSTGKFFRYGGDENEEQTVYYQDNLFLIMLEYAMQNTDKTDEELDTFINDRMTRHDRYRLQNEVFCNNEQLLSQIRAFKQKPILTINSEECNVVDALNKENIVINGKEKTKVDISNSTLNLRKMDEYNVCYSDDDKDTKCQKQKKEASCLKGIISKILGANLDDAITKQEAYIYDDYVIAYAWPEVITIASWNKSIKNHLQTIKSYAEQTRDTLLEGYKACADHTPPMVCSIYLAFKSLFPQTSCIQKYLNTASVGEKMIKNIQHSLRDESANQEIILSINDLIQLLQNIDNDAVTFYANTEKFNKDIIKVNRKLADLTITMNNL